MLAKGVSGMSIPADAGRDQRGPEVAPDPPDPSFGPEAAEEERVEYGESDSSFGGDVGDAGWGRH